MTPQEFEFFASRAIQNAIHSRQVEDSRIEFKSQWKKDYEDYNKLARRLGGHANSARRDEIIWIIGVDEKSGDIVGADKAELTQWWQGVKNEFHAQPPELVLDRIITIHDQLPVVALLFETTATPYLVKNFLFGKAGQVIQYEVPWRETTSVRTATHNDLLKILVPYSKLPHIEVLNCKITKKREGGEYDIGLEANFYIVPKDERRISIPIHKWNIKIKQDEIHIPITAPGIIFSSSVEFGILIVTQGGLIINGPDRFKLSAGLRETNEKLSFDRSIDVSIVLFPDNTDQPLEVNMVLNPSERGNYDHAVWKYYIAS